MEGAPGVGAIDVEHAGEGVAAPGRVQAAQALHLRSGVGGEVADFEVQGVRWLILGFGV